MNRQKSKAEPVERPENIERLFPRRKFLGATAGLLAMASGFGCSREGGASKTSVDGQPTVSDLLAMRPEPVSSPDPREPWPISLAQWSLHREHFGDWVARGEWDLFGERLQSDPSSLLGGPLAPLDFPATARELGFSAVEYVNTFFFDKAEDVAFLTELRQRCSDVGVRSLLVMCDALGSTGDPSSRARKKAVENHFPWIDAAAFLGCHSVRVNAYSEGSYEEQQERVADGLRQLCEYADSRDINVLVENHGGLSSDAEWLVGVMEKVDHPRAGTLPDFGNFKISDEPEEWYDRYRGVEELMPLAGAVSAKSYDFDDKGEETTIDFGRMLAIVAAAGYRGFIGVEYEGSGPEREGILATRALIERYRRELLPA